MPRAADGPAATAAAAADAGEQADGTPAEPPANPELEAFQRQFAALQENTGDFNGWCSAISAAEKLVRHRCPSQLPPRFPL